MLCFWSPCLHRVFTVFKGIWKENVPGLIVALIQAEPGGLRLSLSPAISNRSRAMGDGGEQSWKAAHISTYSHDVFPLPLLLNLSSASTEH